MKKKYLLIVFISVLLTGTVKSQDYLNAVGVRAGLSQGITYKHFLTTKDAAEGIFAVRWGGFHLTGLYERHMGAFDVERLYFFYGGGAHLGSWNSSVSPWFEDNNSNIVLGIDGIVGLEYVFYEIPFNISLDWKPGFNLIGHTGFWGDEVALSLRFMF